MLDTIVVFYVTVKAFGLKGLALNFLDELSKGMIGSRYMAKYPSFYPDNRAAIGRIGQVVEISDTYSSQRHQG